MFTRHMLAQSWRSWLSHSAPRVGPAWLLHMWTFLWCAVLAVGFTIIGFASAAGGEAPWGEASYWARRYGEFLIITCCIGYTIRLLFGLGWRWLGDARIKAFGPLRRLAFYAGLPILAMLVAWPTGMWLAGYDGLGMFLRQDAGSMTGSILSALLISFLFYLFFAMKNRQIAAERRATEARLKLLQGQIEPHFLFNTLANVASLMEHDTPRARLMLETFVDYLRASLGSLRVAEHTLGDELVLVDAYLRIIQIRMDTRLVYRIDVPDALRALPLPALTLQPLVENAVQHGLEPKIEGGTVSVTARLEGPSLVLTVTDDGLGLATTPAQQRRSGSGTALANIRERLSEAHGSAAALSITSGTNGGVRAMLTLPAT
ncbi:MAG: histidine kinase [Burkholderiaceae bacterium]